MKPVVLPPYECQHRAWECAYALREDYANELPIADRVAVEVVCRTHPEGLGWLDLSRMFVLYGETVAVRV